MRQVIGALLLAVSAVINAAALPASDSPLGRRAITQDLMDDFIRFTNLSFAATSIFVPCDTPLGLPLVKTLDSSTTDTQGFIVRDDSAKQIIVSFRGSSSIQDFVTDILLALVTFSSPGVVDTKGAKAHYGFLTAYNSVASDVISTVASELEAHPDYELISTGHSLGGALASLGGVSLAANFPNSPLRVFTFGQPRTGDSAYADLAEDLIGVQNIYRAVHTSDGVPTLIPTFLGYEHHATEYWNFEDPSTDIDNVKVCSGREDPTCSDSIISGGINIPHLTYFGLNILEVVFNPSIVCF